MESSEHLRRQLLFLADRRSMAEMEQILARFLKERLSHLEEEACRRIMALLQQTDADLLDWLPGLKEPPEGVDREVLGWISPYCSRSRSEDPDSGGHGVP